MSLINQMLRDLEQRNTKKPDIDQRLELKTNNNQRVGKWRWLWLLPLFALPSAYIWLSKPLKQLDFPIAVQNKPSVIVEHQPATTAVVIEPKMAEPETKPTQISVPTADTLSMTETEMPIVKPENASPLAKPPVKPLAAKKRNKQIASAPEKAELLYRQAQTSVSNIMTKEILSEALQVDPYYLPARTLLLQTLLKLHASSQELIGFTENSLQLFPDNLLFIKTRAHLYIQQKNFAAAVDLLEKADPERVEDSHYLSLLAAGYQQLQRFSQSARIYQQLTRIQPDKAENWLGLAIAHDKLNQTGPAAQAYRLALDKKTLSSEVVDYINQRLSALN